MTPLEQNVAKIRILRYPWGNTDIRAWPHLKIRFLARLLFLLIIFLPEVAGEIWLIFEKNASNYEYFKFIKSINLALVNNERNLF